MHKTMLYFLLIALVCWVLLNISFYFMQPSMIFFPNSEMEATPRDWGLDYEDLKLDSNGHKIHAWWIPSADKKEAGANTLIYFHGNAGNISHRRESILSFHNMALDQIIIDYSGYGLSEGVAGEQAMYQDAMAAWRYLTLTRKIPPKQIVLFGRSLGGAVAADLALRLQPTQAPAGLILESTFTSAKQMAKRVFPLLSAIIYKRFKFDTYRKLHNYPGPLLVIHAPEDEVIPFHMGKQNFAQAGRNKTFVELHGSHDTAFLINEKAHSQAIMQFISRL